MGTDRKPKMSDYWGREFNCKYFNRRISASVGIALPLSTDVASSLRTATRKRTSKEKADMTDPENQTTG